MPLPHQMPAASHGRAPNALVVILMLVGGAGTGAGYIRTQAAEASASVSQREADKAMLARNRFEDLSNHCMERQMDLIREQRHAQ